VIDATAIAPRGSYHSDRWATWVAGVDAPANAKVELTSEQAAPWTYGEATINSLRKIDYTKLNETKADWGDRWNEIFGR
jgi:hypothetical protein